MGRVSRRVQWYEGMLLEPQHFQQMDLRLSTLSLNYLMNASPFFWGVRRLTIDTAALLAGTVRITELEATLPDGSLAEVNSDDTSYPELEIKSVTGHKKTDALTIYLAVVRYRPDSANTQGDFPRYLSTQEGPVIDESTGESGIFMPKLQLKVLVLAGDIPPRYVTFPIAKVVYRDDGYVLGDFVPPRTDVINGSHLHKIVSDVTSDVREKINFLSSKIQSSGSNQNEPLFKTYQTYYDIIAPLAPKLECLVHAQLVSPMTVFAELCRMSGEAARMIPGQIPPIFPAYQHDDILATFKPVIAFIKKMLNLVKRISLAIPFVKNDRLFNLKLQPDWAWNNTWVLGVRKSASMNEKDVTNWLNGAVVATEGFIDSAKERRVLGAEKTIAEQIPALGLLPEEGALFVIVKNDPEFIDTSSKLIIMNQNDTEDMRPEVISLYIAAMGDSTS